MASPSSSAVDVLFACPSSPPHCSDHFADLVHHYVVGSDILYSGLHLHLALLHHYISSSDDALPS
jgi:cytochrome b561